MLRTYFFYLYFIFPIVKKNKLFQKTCCLLLAITPHKIPYMQYTIFVILKNHWLAQRFVSKYYIEIMKQKKKHFRKHPSCSAAAWCWMPGARSKMRGDKQMHSRSRLCDGDQGGVRRAVRRVIYVAALCFGDARDQRRTKTTATKTQPIRWTGGGGGVFVIICISTCSRTLSEWNVLYFVRCEWRTTDDDDGGVALVASIRSLRIRSIEKCAAIRRGNLVYYTKQPRGRLLLLAASVALVLCAHEYSCKAPRERRMYSFGKCERVCGVRIPYNSNTNN